MIDHLWTTVACSELRESRFPLPWPDFRVHNRETRCGFTYTLLALRVVCKASNRAVDSIMERVMWSLFCAYKRASRTGALTHVGELAAACYQSGICPISLKAQVVAHVPELESAWAMACTVDACVATEPGGVEVPTSTVRPALRHMYMRLACNKSPSARCPPRAQLPAGAPVCRPPAEPLEEPMSDARPVKRPIGTKVVRIRSTVEEGTRGIAWWLVVVSPAEARAASIAAKEWMKRDAERVPAVKLKLAPRAAATARREFAGDG